ncbi:Rossmann fold nucleotide-binding protein [Nocardioides sp. GY 10127]|uniref:LOG family protein n=1 Tax=Nocardioides sp. GY 10127 TaxID=2569762 RepID=UPI0010A9058B|nr:Rossmann fold nucleotide-binding protein [Nocardioides sp. GY 10127]TIC80866.1 Rossmann fold nucleotide-binding protein [Nocardioides sp. GY 10127]
MRHTRGRTVDVTSTHDLRRRLDGGARTLSGWRLRGLDLTGLGHRLRRADVAGATFLGCTFAEGDAEHVDAAGALVLPALPDVPVDVYRAGLYSADELYDAPTWADSLDGRAYAWSQEQDPAVLPEGATTPPTLARALHDHAIDLALGRWREGRSLVGVMGGHQATRTDEQYAAAARLGLLLATEGADEGHPLSVTTGGGPGAMEAANLGARLSGGGRAAGEDALAAALGRLAVVPTYRPSIDAWAMAARDVLAEAPPAPDAGTLGIPTWHYGHEPPNLFATAIAKYFRNATREAILLEVCDAGIVFLQGAGGTVQEVFQDACENYYADEESVAPMVLVGRRYWTEELPAWPLLAALARGRAMEEHVHLVDDVEEAAAIVTGAGPGGRGSEG